jgi:hypothetical protein
MRDSNARPLAPEMGNSSFPMFYHGLKYLKTIDFLKLMFYHVLCKSRWSLGKT